MTALKFCGMMREEDIRAANELLPDYVGVIFYEKSRRYVSPETAHRLRSLLKPEISAVGVFVDAPIEIVLKYAESVPLQMIQLHGAEDEDYLKVLKEKTALPILRAFRIWGSEDLLGAESCSADLILLDAGAGDGKTFDWNLLRDFRRPYLLAGGLNPENAPDAIRLLHPFGLDVSSGIETDGRKDPEKMRLFLENCRQTDRKEDAL